jgi:hypothetical protein
VSLAHAAGSEVVVGRRHWPWFRVSVVVPACSTEAAYRETANVTNKFHAPLVSSGAD